MTLATPSDDWSDTLTVTADTIFQCRAGSVLLDIGATADVGSTDGLLLTCDPMRPLYDSFVVPAGNTVRWRRMVPSRPTTLYYAVIG